MILRSYPPCITIARRRATILMAIFHLLCIHLTPSTISAANDEDLNESALAPWIDSFLTRPNVTLFVCYDLDWCPDEGEVLGMKDASRKPYVTTFGLDKKIADDYYCYIMLDTDVINPLQPYAKNFVHWLVYNIPSGISPEKNITDAGTTMVSYIHPQDSFVYHGSTGVHRFYCLIFKQANGRQEFEPIKTLATFDTRSFIAKYDLGFPLAGLMFKVDYDN